MVSRIMRALHWLILLSFTCTAIATPEKNLWARWTINNPQSTATIDYLGWQNFLDKYVLTSPNKISLVNYKAVSAQDLQKLKRSIANLAALPIDNYNRKEQLAYWINLYNALLVATILDHYPIKSIRDIKLSGWFSRGPWDAKLIKVANIPISLSDIEHRIVRPIWANPLTHYALNCGAYSCPNLQKMAFNGANVDELMNLGARQYINSPRGLIIAQGNRLIVSSLYWWYRADFGETDTAIISHLKKYANPDLKQRLDKIDHISEHYFNWTLNQTIR